MEKPSNEELVRELLETQRMSLSPGQSLMINLDRDRGISFVFHNHGYMCVSFIHKTEYSELVSYMETFAEPQYDGDERLPDERFLDMLDDKLSIYDIYSTG